MNILLANMPIKFNHRENREPPLGICYIASMLKDLYSTNVFLKDYEVSRFSDEKLKKDLEELKIDILGISFRTASYHSAKQFIKKAIDINRNIFIVAGGHHATAFPKETLMDLGADAVVIGEGEYTFRELVERLIKKIPLEGLEGIIYKNKNSDIVLNKKREHIKNLDALPLPARELLDIDKYNVITLLTSRGCPYNCIYCDKGISTRKVKFRSADKIFDEIKYIVTCLKRKRLYIVDDHFFLRKDRLEHILDKIIAEKLSVKWICQSRVDGITMDILKKAKQAGCEQIIYGIESGDERELKYIRKSANNHEAEAAVRLANKNGITVRANFMLGFPISTRQSIRNTINFAKKLKPDIVRFFSVSPLPNTYLWDNIYGKGCVPEDIKWENIDFFKPSFDMKGIPREELSLYITAAYWHLLKTDFLTEITIKLFPNLIKLLCLIIKTRKIRGNISRVFQRSVNLVIDNIHQIKGKNFWEIFKFSKKVHYLEKVL